MFDASCWSRYTYDTAWHKEAQALKDWFAWYPTRRYGSANEHATAAWEVLRTTVYNYAGCGGFGGYHDGSGVEWKVWGSPPVRGLFLWQSTLSGRVLSLSRYCVLVLKTHIRLWYRHALARPPPMSQRPGICWCKLALLSAPSSTYSGQ